ncbi:hypothetical protein LTS10_011875 [Elasticomyces elasticus]|nr:hypothetical protein LTS10_011875 [Elasticomyces elasticus]
MATARLGLGFVCGLLLTLLVLQTLVFWHYSGEGASPLIRTRPTASRHNAHIDQPWHFDTARDANNIAFTASQCDATFPNLYAEIDRSVKLWRDKKHTITAEDTSIAWRRDAAFRLLIHNNTLRILETKDAMNDAYRPRVLAVMNQLHNALLGAQVSGEQLPDIEFAVTVDDMSLIPNGNDTHAIWAFTRRLVDRDQDRCWMIPDFNFWQGGPPGTGSFYEAGRRARRNDGAVAEKIPKVVWRGVAWTNEGLRGPLLEKTEGKTWADVEETVWENRTNFMELDELCKYAFVLHTEGRSWSGRLKYLMNCDSVPVVHDLDWTTHWYHLLVPKGKQQNYIPVKRDWSDLDKKVKHHLIDTPAAQRVAERAVGTFRDRYLTAAAEACYWRRLVKGYSEVAVTPEIYDLSVAREERLRGISFEEFVLLGTDWQSPAENGR